MLLLLLIVAAAAPVAGDGQPAVQPPLKFYCSSTGAARTYLPNSTLGANLAKLYAAFPDNTSAHGGFLKASFGAAPDTVYALALCRADVVGADCTACLEAAFRNAQDLCGYSKDLTVYQDQCHVRVSDLDFLDLGVGANRPTSQAWDDMGNVISNLDSLGGWNWPDPHDNGSVAFVVAGIVSAFLHETAVFAAYTTRRRFGTAVLDIGSSGALPTFRSMAQCTPDLSRDDCFTCLEKMITENVAMVLLQGQQGGRILGVRCSFRYGSYFIDGGEPMWVFEPMLPQRQQGRCRSKLATTTIIEAVVPVLVLLVCFCIGFGWIRSRRKALNFKKLHLKDETSVEMQQDEELDWTTEGKVSSEFSLFDIAQIQEATSNFSEENKLGQGGFGPVYKGKLSDGLEIAVKRLSTNSGRGFVEFKNEVQLIAKLQHTNLVRLLGCCSQGRERMLVYEYLPNKSLDFFIFGAPEKRALIDWKQRLMIIQGIAQGLLYLHKHSRLHIIHRDLKASNILLDRNMSPKISDFGIAKIFISNDIEDNTNTVVGTYGYMAPEYAYEGLFSSKSDVFSFGVLLLEIVSGKRNFTVRQNGSFLNLLGYAWHRWKDGRWRELVDASLVIENCALELFKCINIALLCVQENAADRPTMWDVTTMLSAEGASLPEPDHPAYYNVMVANAGELDIDLEGHSINEVTITDQEAR